MSATGRKSDFIWKYYGKNVVPNRKGCTGCKNCGKTMEGQIAELKDSSLHKLLQIYYFIIYIHSVNCLAILNAISNI